MSNYLLGVKSETEVLVLKFLTEIALTKCLKLVEKDPRKSIVFFFHGNLIDYNISETQEFVEDMEFWCDSREKE